jgi:hypothetical protein
MLFGILEGIASATRDFLPLCPKSSESVFSVIKTETEIYLAQ